MARRRADTEYVTTSRAAAILGIKKPTLIRWINSGRLPVPEVDPRNGYYLWKISDLEAIRMILKEMQS